MVACPQMYRELHLNPGMSGEGDICFKCSAILWICLKLINLCPHVQLAEEVIFVTACLRTDWGCACRCGMGSWSCRFLHPPGGDSSFLTDRWVRNSSALVGPLLSSLNLFNRLFMFSACQRGMLRWSNVPGSTLKYIAIVLWYSKLVSWHKIELSF